MSSASQQQQQDFSSILAVGTRIRQAREGHIGVVRFIGPLPELDQKDKPHPDYIWAGVEWLHAPAGKNDGATPSRRIFGPVAANHGSFLRLGVRSDLLGWSNAGSQGRVGDPIAHVILRERSLAYVLTERYHGGALGFDEEREDGKTLALSTQKQEQQCDHDHAESSVGTAAAAAESSPGSTTKATAAASAKRTSRDPFDRDSLGRWVNVVTVDCASSESCRVVSRAGKSLARLFPNLQTVSVAGCLLQDVAQVILLASHPTISSLNVSDNPLQFPATAKRGLDDELLTALLLPDGYQPSPSLRSFNCTSTIKNSGSTSAVPPQLVFLFFLVAFPRITEYVFASNGLSAFDHHEIASQHEQQLASTLCNLQHLVLAHNHLTSLDSFVELFLWARKASGGREPALSALSLSHNDKLAQTMSPCVHAQLCKELDGSGGAEQQAASLLPHLKSLLIRSTHYGWNEMLRLVEPANRLVGSELQDMSILECRCLHPERATAATRGAFDPMMLALLDAEGGHPLSDGERRRLSVAMLCAVPALSKLNGTHVERTNWFGERALGRVADRPELRGAKKWAAGRFSQIAASELNHRAKAILEEFEEDVRAEAAARAAIAQAGPKLMKDVTEIRLRVVPIFVASGTSALALAQSSFSEQVEQLVASMYNSSNNSSSTRDHGDEDTNKSATAASFSVSVAQRRDSQMRSQTLRADARWSTADLELAVAALLGLVDEEATIVASSSPATTAGSVSRSASGYVPSRVHDSAEAWVLLDLATVRLRRAQQRLAALTKPQQQQQQREKENEGAVSDAEAAAKLDVDKARQQQLQEWEALYPPGSLALFHLDMELCGNPGAVRAQKHVQQLLRPGATLHGSRVNNDDVVLVLVHQ